MDKFELKFDPKTIEHLGVKMYSTLPPALAELISNSYDADAGNVKIEFYEQNGIPKTIIVTDDGIGMSFSDIQDKFLVIGRNRREKEGDKPSRKFGRLPTGKKGLGKLALFGLAKQIIVDTVQEGMRNRFELNWDDLLNSTDGVYKPIIKIKNEKTDKKSMTRIELSELKRKSSFDLELIADSLSRIFIVDSTFKINLGYSGGKPIAVEDSRRYKSIEAQFEWNENNLVQNSDEFKNKENLSFKLITAKTPIPPGSGLRGVALFSRGKLVNLPEYFSDSTSSHFFQYLTGWIKVDFVDLVKEEDVISTNRQSINWDNDEMMELRRYLAQIIYRVAVDWRKKRSEKKDKDLEVITGVDRESWFRSMPSEIKDSVRSIVNKLEGDDVDESYSPVVKALYDLVPQYPLLHWRHLHPKVKSEVEVYYRNEQYGHAADQGVKIYCDLIGELSRQDKDGIELAGFFGYRMEGGQVVKPPVLQLNLLATKSERNIQDGQIHLTQGVIAGFRNPISHSPMKKVVPEVFTELDCLNILSLVSYLVTKLDNVKINSPST